MSKPGFKRNMIVAAFLAVPAISLAGVFIFPNPVGNHFISEAKAYGLMEYKPDEAYHLAMKICTQCHSIERIKLYCPRCGPPFVAVVPHMQVFIENYKSTKPDLKFQNITEHQAVAIVQVWNALVGNWEGDFREKDILKLIGKYPRIAALYKTPPDKRKIESALSQRDDLKVGHMSGMADAQKNLGKPENIAPPPEDKTDKMEHGNHESHGHEGHDAGH